MDKVIRWGILGTGKIAHALARALADVPDAELVAVASRSSASSTAFGLEFGVTRCHASYQALADDPDVDVIYVATPHTLHADNMLMCLNAGKHVLCEKAFTMNRREAAQVIALARQKNLFVMEAMWSRFLPGALAVQRIIASGEIGAVQQVQADLGFVCTFGPEHRLLNPQLGGGALLDIGIYPLSMAAFFAGPVVEAQAMAQIGATGVDEQTVFSLRHASGAVSSCSSSLRSQTPNEMTINGTLGRIRLHGRFYMAQSFTVEIRDGATRHVDTPFTGNGYAHEVIEVMRCIRAGLIESPAMPHAESIALMEVLDTMRGQIGLVYDADLD